jgi:hypothetical protein
VEKGYVSVRAIRPWLFAGAISASKELMMSENEKHYIAIAETPNEYHSVHANANAN